MHAGQPKSLNFKNFQALNIQLVGPYVNINDPNMCCDFVLILLNVKSYTEGNQDFETHDDRFNRRLPTYV